MSLPSSHTHVVVSETQGLDTATLTYKAIQQRCQGQRAATCRSEILRHVSAARGSKATERGEGGTALAFLSSKSCNLVHTKYNILASYEFFFFPPRIFFFSDFFFFSFFFCLVYLFHLFIYLFFFGGGEVGNPCANKNVVGESGVSWATPPPSTQPTKQKKTGLCYITKPVAAPGGGQFLIFDCFFPEA